MFSLSVFARESASLLPSAEAPALQFCVKSATRYLELIPSTMDESQLRRRLRLKGAEGLGALAASKTKGGFASYVLCHFEGTETIEELVRIPALEVNVMRLNTAIANGELIEEVPQTEERMTSRHVRALVRPSEYRMFVPGTAALLNFGFCQSRPSVDSAKQSAPVQLLFRSRAQGTASVGVALTRGHM